MTRLDEYEHHKRLKIEFRPKLTTSLFSSIYDLIFDLLL